MLDFDRSDTSQTVQGQLTSSGLGQASDINITCFHCSLYPVPGALAFSNILPISVHHVEIYADKCLGLQGFSGTNGGTPPDSLR